MVISARNARRLLLVPAAFFTLLLALSASTAAWLRPSPLIAALAALLAWSAAVSLHAALAPGRKRLRPLILPLGVLATAAASLIALVILSVLPIPSVLSSTLYLLPPSAASSSAPVSLLPLLIVAAFAAFFLQTHATLRAASPTPTIENRKSKIENSPTWSPTLNAAVLKLLTLVLALTAALLFAQDRFTLPLLAPWSFALLFVTGAWILETALRQFARLYTPARFLAASPPPALGWLLLPFLPKDQRRRWLAPVDADTPVIVLADMWFLPTLRRLALPLLAFAALLAWLTTAFHEIPHGSTGLLSRFGRMDPAPLHAGLHLTLPYPLNEVAVLPHQRLQRVVLGLEADTGKPILWDRDHYVGETGHLVGSGEELLTISVPIYFHVSDPVAHFRHTIDSAAVIRDLAYQELLAETLRRPAFAIMTGDRDALSATLRAKLQTALDRRHSGLAIDLVCLRDIHPPVQVGPAYQEVVSAIEEREAFIHEGETYRAENLPRARSDSARLRADADASRSSRLARASGEAARFDALLASYRASPDIFRIRETYAAFDQSLRGVKKLLVDDTFRGRLPTVVDIRKTLNPDFAPPLAPDSPALIPTLSEKLTDFDRAVEGYLQMGQGAIPATAPRPPDPDNLLTTP